MNLLFEEIDSQPSPLGEISLRRRKIPALGDRDIYEVKLGEEFLMSSMFVDGEIALADLALAAIEGDNLKVIVGGLGLGYTADAVLKSERVSELAVVDALETVINWHRQELVPLGKSLNADSRCEYVLGNFFELAVNPEKGFRLDRIPELVDLILLDIDHSPVALLNERNASFYTVESLTRMKDHLRKGGVFALWSNEPPQPSFMEVLHTVFSFATSHEVAFYNPLQNGQAANTIYIARV